MIHAVEMDSAAMICIRDDRDEQTAWRWRLLLQNKESGLKKTEYAAVHVPN
jgi:hypothetical protein